MYTIQLADLRKCFITVLLITMSVSFARSQVARFGFTGSVQTFTVPHGVTSLQVEIAGASGGQSFSNRNRYGSAGLGGKVTATIAVTPGQQLDIYVGSAGADGTAIAAGSGGYNGGANGGLDNETYTGGGGGGASDIRMGNGLLKQRLVVAGGGGASGRYGAGGNGGGLEGAGGYGEGDNAAGGGQHKGGLSGCYYLSFFASNGSFGKGGASSAGDHGGGGGGGWYGGGGGAFGDGAGGSSYAGNQACSIVHTQGVNDGNGYVTITWTKPDIAGRAYTQPHFTF